MNARVHVHTHAPFLADLADLPERVAFLAGESLRLELETWPKPGLVSHVDSGSHDDMDAATFRASIRAIAPHFGRLALAGANGSDMNGLRRIGREAEAAMLRATGGVNTHRGAIFGVGLLAAALGARAAGVVDPACSLGTVVSRVWGKSILDDPLPLHTHGSVAQRRFGAGGARVEAANGFRSVYDVGVPALRFAMRMRHAEPEAARVHACFALIACTEDTNLLHRGGPAGLALARESARRFLHDGGVATADWRLRAQIEHRRFVAANLSPGGVADLLAMSLFVSALDNGGSA